MICVEILFILLLIWNFIVFIMYGEDKLYSKNKAHRVKEKRLIISAFLLGSIGALLGMALFNHKTAKRKFLVLIPLSLIFNAAVICLILYIA